MNKGALFLCGNGISRPFDMTLRTLQILASCDAIFYGHGEEDGVLPILRKFCPGVRIISRPVLTDYSWGNDRYHEICDDICRYIEDGKRVCYLSQGHPLLFSEALDIRKECARRGHKVYAIPSISAIDSLLDAAARLDPRFSFQGFSVYQSVSVACGGVKLTPEAPTIIFDVYDSVATGRFEEFCFQLERNYPPKHLFYMIECEGSSFGKIRFSNKVDKFCSFRTKISEFMSLILPGVEALERR